MARFGLTLMGNITLLPLTSSAFPGPAQKREKRAYSFLRKSLCISSSLPCDEPDAQSLAASSGATMPLGLPLKSKKYTFAALPSHPLLQTEAFLFL